MQTTDDDVTQHTRDLLDWLQVLWRQETQPAKAATDEVAAFLEWVRGKLRDVPVVGADFRHGSFGVILQDGSSFALSAEARILQSQESPVFSTSTPAAVPAMAPAASSKTSSDVSVDI